MSLTEFVFSYVWINDKDHAQLVFHCINKTHFCDTEGKDALFSDKKAI